MTSGGPVSRGGARRPGVGDIPHVCSVFADGFDADPVWGWAFGDAGGRRERLSAWFAVLVAQGVANESVWTTRGGESAALWVPAGLPEVDASREAELESTIRDRCGARAELLFEIFSIFEENHPHHPELHYLSLLATSDQHRGMGLGMDLLRCTLDGVDRVGAPAYLESTNPANLRRYEAVGFAPYGSFTLPDRGPTVTTMWRDPVVR